MGLRISGSKGNGQVCATFSDPGKNTRILLETRFSLETGRFLRSCGAIISDNHQANHSIAFQAAFSLDNIAGLTPLPAKKPFQAGVMFSAALYQMSGKLGKMLKIPRKAQISGAGIIKTYGALWADQPQPASSVAIDSSKGRVGNIGQRYPAASQDAAVQAPPSSMKAMLCFQLPQPMSSANEKPATPTPRSTLPEGTQSGSTENSASNKPGVQFEKCLLASANAGKGSIHRDPDDISDIPNTVVLERMGEGLIPLGPSNSYAPTKNAPPIWFWMHSDQRSPGFVSNKLRSQSGPKCSLPAMEGFMTAKDLTEGNRAYPLVLRQMVCNAVALSMQGKGGKWMMPLNSSVHSSDKQENLCDQAWQALGNAHTPWSFKGRVYSLHSTLPSACYGIDAASKRITGCVACQTKLGWMVDHWLGCLPSRKTNEEIKVKKAKIASKIQFWTPF